MSKYEQLSLDCPGIENPNYMGDYEKLLNERTIEILDMKPEKKDLEKTPLVFFTGWASTPKTVEKSLQYLVDRGRRVLCVKFPRSKVIKNASRKDVAVEHLQQAYAGLIAAEQKGIKKKIIAGHSQGGICAILATETIAKELSPDEIEKVVLIGSAGMIGEDNVWSLIRRSQRESTQNTPNIFKEPGTIMRIGKYLIEFAKYILANPRMAAREVKAISEADIMEKIKDLEKIGVKVEIIHGKDDKVFPIERVREQICKGGGNLIEVEGGHLKFIFEPKTMSEIEEVLDKR